MTKAIELLRKAIKIKNDMANLALEGLNIDGAHHKQWYLLKILELAFDEDLSDTYEKYDAIAP